MHTPSILLAACGLLAAANPLPQDIDLDLVAALPDPVYSTSLSSIAYNPSTILAAALAQITSSVDPLTLTADSVATLSRRDTACQPQAAGATGAPSVADTPSAFVASPDFASAARNAPAASGYTQTFSNLQASNNAYGYMGYTRIDTYDVQACANQCQKINGCMSFNIYFERAPSVEPGSSCANPSSVTLIKCAFWGGPINPGNAVNSGQYRDQFQVVIAGSNGYQNSSLTSPPGYTGPTYLGKAAINAPYDAYGFDSYMGVAVFTSGPFDPALCAAACTAKSKYNLAHPPTDGSPTTTCKFFNTYILAIEGKGYQGQYCAMYSESWPAKYATNVGQYRGSDHYIIEYSYTFSNATDAGQPCRDCAVHQASKEITRSTLQSYCSTILGYTTPSATVYVTATTTPTSTITQTVAVTSTASVTVITTVALRRRDTEAPSMTPTISVSDGLVVKILVSATAIAARALATPSILTKYPADVVSDACSLVASPVTATVTNTILTTVVGPTAFVTTYTSQTNVITTTSTSTTTTTTRIASPTPLADVPCGQIQNYGGLDLGYECNFAWKSGGVLNSQTVGSFNECRDALIADGPNFGASYDFSTSTCRQYSYPSSDSNASLNANDHYIIQAAQDTVFMPTRDFLAASTTS